MSMEPGALSRSGDWHALEEVGGPKVDVLIELAAHGQEQAVQRDVVGHVGTADGAEEDGVVACAGCPSRRRGIIWPVCL